MKLAGDRPGGGVEKRWRVFIAANQSNASGEKTTSSSQKMTKS